jgi:tripartite-type tricarboxylate transporter receptor subunit TctC
MKEVYDMKSSVSMKLVWLGLAVALALGMASAASAQPGEFVKGVLQPLADGFPNRPITLINIDDAASRDGVYTRMVQQALRGISPVDILVTDEPAPSHGNWYVAVDVTKRKGGKEGYYPMLWSTFGATTDLHIEPIEKELGVSLDDVKACIVMESQGDVFFQRKNAPWGPTFAGFVKWAKANPGKARYVSVDVGSGNDIRSTHLIQILGIEVEKIPMGGHQAVASTIGAGEGDFTLGAPDMARINWEAGRVDVTMVVGDKVPPPWDKDPNIVSSKEAGIPPMLRGGTKAWGVRKEVPQERIEWLFKLFKAAAETDVYQKHVKNVPNLRLELLGPAEGDAHIRKIFKDSLPVIRGVGLHWDQQKK